MIISVRPAMPRVLAIGRITNLIMSLNMGLNVRLIASLIASLITSLIMRTVPAAGGIGTHGAAASPKFSGCHGCAGSSGARR